VERSDTRYDRDVRRRDVNPVTVNEDAKILPEDHRQVVRTSFNLRLSVAPPNPGGNRVSRYRDLDPRHPEFELLVFLALSKQAPSRRVRIRFELLQTQGARRYTTAPNSSSPARSRA